MSEQPEALHDDVDKDDKVDMADEVAPNKADLDVMKPPEEMTEEELRLLADTMPGEGPGGD